MLIGAPRKRAAGRFFGGVCAQIVAEAPCSVTVVRPQADA
jgi:nucleotide-binding universal stress UspA family protein